MSDWSSDVCSSDLSSPSKCTSTTAPMTWVMRPLSSFAILASLRFLERFGARNDFRQFRRDHRLARALVFQRQLADHLAGVARGARSEERRLGNECVGPVSTWCWRIIKKKNK